MNTTSSLNKAREELERAKTKAAADANAAQLARKVARAAKLRLKQARKLSKMARKSARRADAKSEESSDALDSAQAKVEKLRKRLRKEQPKKDPARLARRPKVPQKGAPKQKVARGKDGLPHGRPKSKLSENTKTPTPREPPVEPRRRTKAGVRRAPETRRPGSNVVKVTPKRPPSATASKPNPILRAGQNPGDEEPLHAPDFDAPAAAG